MMPFSAPRALMMSVSNHSSRKSATLIVMTFVSWWKVFLGRPFAWRPSSARVRRPRSPGLLGSGGTMPRIGFTANAISYIIWLKRGAISASRGEWRRYSSIVLASSG
jgi:hypothetical protein